MVERNHTPMTLATCSGVIPKAMYTLESRIDDLVVGLGGIQNVMFKRSSKGFRPSSGQDPNDSNHASFRVA